jgi:hypothetical protein
MKKALILLAAAVGVGVVATVATDPQPTRERAASVVRGVLYGLLILGSNAWPSVPVDAQSRRLLWTANCKEECGLGSAAPVDE